MPPVCARTKTPPTNTEQKCVEGCRSNGSLPHRLICQWNIQDAAGCNGEISSLCSSPGWQQDKEPKLLLSGSKPLIPAFILFFKSTNIDMELCLKSLMHPAWMSLKQVSQAGYCWNVRRVVNEGASFRFSCTVSDHNNIRSNRPSMKYTLFPHVKQCNNFTNSVHELREHKAPQRRRLPERPLPLLSSPSH